MDPLLGEAQHHDANDRSRLNRFQHEAEIIHARDLRTIDLKEKVAAADSRRFRRPPFIDARDE